MGVNYVYVITRPLASRLVKIGWDEPLIYTLASPWGFQEEEVEKWRCARTCESDQWNQSSCALPRAWRLAVRRMCTIGRRSMKKGIQKEPAFCAYILHIRALGSYAQCGGVRGKSVSISVCTESIKHQKENAPNINWPRTLILGGEGKTHSPAPLSCATAIHAERPV